MKSLSGRLDRLEASLLDRTFIQEERDSLVPYFVKAFQLSENQVDAIFWRTMGKSGPTPETMNEMLDELSLLSNATDDLEAFDRRLEEARG